MGGCLVMETSHLVFAIGRLAEEEQSGPTAASAVHGRNGQYET